MTHDFQDKLDAWREQEGTYRTEGRRGIEALCKLASALGYKDPQYYGQLSRGAVLGDLMCMLEDNSGMIEAMFEWAGNVGGAEWSASLDEVLEEVVEETEEE